MERWKQMTNGYYISDHGRVKNPKGKLLKVRKGPNGYMYLHNKNPRKTHSRLIHRLVAQYFCKGYKEELDVNHIDAVRDNNHYTNLEWVTRKENIHDSMRRGTHDVTSAHKTLSKKVEIITNEGDVEYYESANEAGRSYGFKSTSHVNKVIRRLKTTIRFKSARYVDDEIVQK